MKLSEIKGIGPQTLEKLAKLKIFSVKDLLYHFPFRYIDRTRHISLSDLYNTPQEDLDEIGENYYSIAEVIKVSKVRIGGSRFISTATVIHDSTKIVLNWFNNPFVLSNLKIGDKIAFSGKVNKKKIFNPKYQIISEEKPFFFNNLEPVYNETKGLKGNQIASYVRFALNAIKIKQDSNIKILKKIIPIKLHSEKRLIDRYEAFCKIHFPENKKDIELSRKYFEIEELYEILLKVKNQKEKYSSLFSNQIIFDKQVHENFLGRLKYKLTESQEKAINEGVSDMSKHIPMHRLLNGDVGSGKTSVAFALALQTCASGFKVVILAPTSILANQHYSNFTQISEGMGLKTVLLTGSTSREHKNLKENDYDVLIGTHAILYRDEIYRDVGLFVIDEQHKFGVKQREFLQNIHLNPKVDGVKAVPSIKKVKIPHILSMSATPIPRSLALSLFGDMDVSFLDKPVSRKEIITKFISNENDMETQMYAWVKKQIKENKEQVFVVCPLIEESEKKEDVKNLKQVYKKIKETFTEFKTNFVYGSLKDKDKIIEDFKEGLIDILVTTSVVEVGIDNPNANIMIIESAERFGLAQLHQIRGRIGRSDRQGYCFIRTSNGEVNDKLDFFCKNSDGFKVAEYDLKSRGPGEVYGNTQSGIPNLKVADITNIELIKEIRTYLY